MRRYALTALGIGGLAALFAVLLHLLGAFGPLSNWLSALFLEKGIFPVEDPARFLWVEIFFVAIVSIGLSWCVIDIAAVALKLLVVLSAYLLVIGFSITCALHGFFLEPFSCLAAVSLVTVGGFVFAGTEKGMRKRVLEEVVGTRVSRITFDRLLEADEPPVFEGAVREVTVVTCLLFDHTELREKLEPSELIQLSNLFLRSVSTFLASRNCYLDESGPELVRGYFGMIEGSDTHAIDACRAALELRSRLRNLSRECETRWFHPLRYGIGISSGPMTIGVYGSQEHRFFSGIGSETEYSRRLARANDRYHSDILVGPPTYRLLSREIEVRPMEMFYDRESDRMTEIYQLLGLNGDLDEAERARRDLYWEGIIRFREGKFENALDAFSRARKPGAEDGPLEYLIERCQAGLAGEDVLPEPEKGPSGKGHARLLDLM